MSDPSLPKIKRVTFKKKRKNQNIKALLKDLYSRIVEKDQKTAQKIEQALVSLSKYPFQLASGKCCYILQGFDKNLCTYVDKQLFNTKKDTELVKECTPQSSKTEDFEACVEPNTSEELDSNAATDEFDVSKKSKYLYRNQYLFSFMLYALAIQEKEYPHKPTLDLAKLMLKVKTYCYDTITDSECLKILETDQKYIKSRKIDGTVQYSLKNLGRHIIKKHNIMLNVPVKSKCTDKLVLNPRMKIDRVPLGPHQVAPAPLTSPINDDPVKFHKMPPGSYEIVMLIDTNEPDKLMDQSKIETETRSLKVGDVIWVARNKINNQELVLPFVIERKRMDDFAASIKDGRFHEQKFRLRKCGLKFVIYLLEDYQRNKHCGLPMATLNQARANTRVQDGFMIYQSASLRDTRNFLEGMTLRLTRELQGAHLQGTKAEPLENEYMSFDYFNASSAKTKPLTVKQLFIKMLLQLKGLSVEKVLAITKKYNSPMALMNAYEDCLNQSEAELMLANLRFNANTPRVTPAMSIIVNLLFDKRF